MLADDSPRIVPVQSAQERGESPRARRRGGSVSDEQFEYEKIGDDEFAGEDRWGRRRVGEKSVDGFDKAVFASAEKEVCLSA